MLHPLCFLYGKFRTRRYIHLTGRDVTSQLQPYRLLLGFVRHGAAMHTWRGNILESVGHQQEVAFDVGSASPRWFAVGLLELTVEKTYRLFAVYRATLSITLIAGAHLLIDNACQPFCLFTSDSIYIFTSET
jgi:hypothetical protein